MMRILERANDWLESRRAPRAVDAQDVAYWQERVLDVAMLVGLVLGAISLVPGVARAALEQNWVLLVADVVVLVVAAVVLLARRAPYPVRAGAVVSLSLGIGLVQLHTSGIHTPGPLWLMAAPIIAAILFDLRWALGLVVLLAVILVGYLVLAWQGLLDPTVAADIGSPRWVETATDLVLISAVTSLFIGVVFRGLHTSFERLGQARRDLEAERGRLIRVNEELSEQVARRRRAEEERAELEGQLRQSHKMKAIGTFAGGIAHDFNNLLVPILGTAEMLSTEVDDALRGQVDDIARSARRARDLIGQILTFSRGAETRRGPVGLETVIEETDRLLRASLPARIELAYEIEEHGPVLLTPSEAQQIIINLATNAFHAMRGSSGRLLLRLDRVRGATLDLVDAVATATPAPDRDYVRLTLADTGTGMDADTLPRIFEPFFTTKEPGEGTGLGLAMVHGVVQATGGLIVARSAPGRGTRMEVLLPLLEHGALEPAAIDGAIPAGAGQVVLMADDEGPVLRVAGMFLERLGYRPVLVGEPEQALERLRHGPAVDLLISDMSMPLMDGVELGRRVRSLRPGLPMILCSGLLDGDTRQRARAAGFDRLLPKPFGRSELSRAVGEVLAGTRVPA